MTQADVAIVGIACRFPGDAKCPSALGDMLMQGRDAWTKVPSSRFNVDAFYHPSQKRKASMVCKGGYFLQDDITKWDAPFFALSSTEAQAVDPQQRLLLEIAYESLENAGIPIEAVAGTDTACYVGGFNSNYKSIISRDLLDTPQYSMTGCASSMLANRVSWFLNLRGPSLTTDTACSSSTAALHLACESIRSNSNKTRCALVGGTSLILEPDDPCAFSTLGFLSPDSRCFAFDSRANGYARGEGVCMLVLKHIDDAIRDGDPIRAVIRATGINSDGRTAGIVLPSSEAQQRLIQSTYDLAGLDPADTQYVEMHGTGTRAGDPAEMGAVIRAMAGRRTTSLYCGSVKTQIGHLEAAAGLAGIIKCVLAMERGTIPPHLNLSTPNPALRLEATGGMVVVPTAPVPWPEAGGVRRCSVNSFGFGGTNVHVVLDDARRAPDPLPAPDPPTGPAPAFVFALSAPEQEAIARQRQAHGDYAGGAGDALLPRLAHTLAQRRSVFQWRHAVVARSVAELRAGWADGSVGPAKAGAAPRVTLLFTGQGAQWAGMGRELMSHGAFARSVRASAAALAGLGCGWDAEAELAYGSRVDVAEFAQPLCAVLQLALVDLLRHWGAVPAAVVGHSSGEMAAAYAAGALDRRSCLKIALHRGLVSRMAQERGPGGGMMAVGLSAAKVRPYLDRGVTLACINSPSSVTLSGDKTELARLQGDLQRGDVFCRLLRVDNAYHGPQMHTIRDEYRRRIADVVPGPESACFHSTVYGRRVAGSELTADYWVANLCSTVDLVSALDDMVDANAGAPGIVVEVGPHGALAGAFNQFKLARGAMGHTSYHSLLVRGQDATLTAMGVAASLWTKGVPIQMDKVNNLDETPGSKTVLTDLPSYSWNHSTSYWHESRLSRNHRFPIFPRHDLIGSRLDSFNPLEPTWVNRLRVAELPWLKDHRVQGNTVFPATGVMCAAVEALRQLEQEAGTAGDVSGFQVSEFSISQPLIIPNNDKGVETYLHLKRRKVGMSGSAGPWLEFSFYSCQDGDVFVEHACGLIQARRKKEAALIDGGRELREETLAYRRYWESKSATCQDALASTTHYEFCESLGISYGKCFQGVTAIRHNGPTVAFETTISDSRSCMPRSYESDHLIHPATLDTLLQTHFVAVRAAEGIPRQAWVPTAVASLVISSDMPRDPGATLRGICETSFSGAHHMTGSLMAGDGTFDTMPAIIVDGLECRGLGATHESSEEPSPELYASVVWKPDIDLLQRPGLHRFVGEGEQGHGDMMQFCVQAHGIVNEMCRLTLERLDAHPRNLPGHLQKYVEWMRTRCATGVGNDPSPPISPRNDVFRPGPSEYWGIDKLQDFVKRYPVDGNLLCHVFGSLDALFAQETTPIASLMASEYFTRFYKEANGAERNARAFQRWFDLKAHKVPGLRVIEIGAGTASTTVPVLRRLGDGELSTPRLSKWTFTDISPGWFENAKSLLSDWQPYVEYKVLDIEDDPVEQGFEAESYDVVLAVNVLHATKDIQTTLRHCSRLLKPGGNLVLGEITNPTDLVSFVFGTLPGWWAAEDDRKGGPLLLRHQWDETLKEAGFSGSDAAITDGDDGVAHRMSTLISTKPYRGDAVSAKNVTVVVPDDCGEATQSLASCICREFQSLGARAAINSVGTAVADVEGKTVVSLLEYEESFLQDAQEAHFEQVKHLVLYSAEVLWVTRSDVADGPGHPSKRIVSGLLRCVKMEDATRRLYEMHLCREPAGDVESVSGVVGRRLRGIWSRNEGVLEEMETSERDGAFCIPRYMPDKTMNQSLARATGSNVSPEMTGLVQAGRPLRLTIGQPGALETLHFVDESLPQALAEDEVEMDVSACGLNFRDVLIAMGELQRPVLGHEAVGIVRRVGAKVTEFSPADRVICITPGVMQTTVRVHESCVHHAPASLSDEEAAAIPIAYATAYQSLMEVARLEKGESVLIHTAAGGLGQALIQLAKMLEADIFCTVSTEAKKQAVVAMGVEPDHVFSSRDLSFERGIKRVTHGRGVDVIVNSLAGEALQRSWMCLAPHGRFVEVGIKDIIGNSRLDMRPFLNNATFSAVNLEAMMRGSRQGRKVVSSVLRLFEQGAIGPIRPIVAHDFSNVEAAFREMQRGTHIGKLVLRFTPESRAPVRPPSFFSWSLDPNATYLLVGGFGGLGRAQATFMAEHGARHLVFISRSGAARDEARLLVAKLAAAGVETKVYAADVADKKQLKAILDEVSQTMPPIRGVIQGAMVLQDTLFHKMDYRQWAAATKPKIQGSWNLHELLPRSLDFFILLSSLAGIIGACSQANYAAGNTYQDALVHFRQSKGLPALSLNLGVIKGFGYVAEHDDVAAGLSPFLTPSVDEAQFFHLLGCALAGTANGDGPLTPQLLVGAGNGGAVQAMQRVSIDADFCWLSTLSPFAYLQRLGVQTAEAAGNEPETNYDRHLDRLRNSKSIDEASASVQELLLGKIASIISIPTADIDTAKPVYTYGVDSLVAVELRNWLAKNLRSDLSIFELTSSTPIHALTRKIAARSRWLSAEAGS